MGKLSDYLAEHDANFRKSRLPALYADFRTQKSLNPDGYEANVLAWSQAVSRLASKGLLSKQGSEPSLLILDVDESLRQSLASGQYGQPQALGAALHDGIANKEFAPLQGFLQQQHTVYQKPWSELPWSVIDWTLQQMGIGDVTRGSDRMPSGQYVVLKNVETASTELSKKVAARSSRFDRVLTKAQFRSKFSSALLGEGEDQRLSAADVDVLLKFLSRDKRIIEYDGQTIRIRGTGEEQEGITQEDSSIASIKELAEGLEHQVALLDRRIDELEREAREAVGRKNRVKALASLRGKKMAEASLAKRYATLTQLEEVAAKLQQAADQVQLVKVMEASAGALRGLNEQLGGAERVDAVMDGLREQVSETDEVAAILAETTGAVVDEGEIDDELEAMEREEREEREKKEKREEEEEARRKMEEMPNVPEAPVVEREKAQSPTAETGIGRLAIHE